MATIKFSDFSAGGSGTPATARVAGFKNGDATANYYYTISDLTTMIFASGSGLTEGSVVFAGGSGVLSQDNTNFFWNDTNNRLGIGVNDPDSFLEVYGTTTQQKWSFDADSFSTMTVAAASHTTFATGESGNLTLDAAGNIVIDSAGTTDIDSAGNVTIDADTGVITFSDGGASLATVASLRQESFIMACSDETTALTAATDVATFRMPYAFTLTAVRASLTTAGTGVNLVTVDIHESGTTILSTKITIDATETTSYTAATPPVISDTSLAVDAEMTVDIDQIDSGGVSAGLKVTLIGHQTP